MDDFLQVGGELEIKASKGVQGSYRVSFTSGGKMEHEMDGWIGVASACMWVL